MSGPPLDREEYIEQTYCFRTFRERLDDNTPAQEILRSLSEELLATTNLPKAVDFLRGEILHAGRISPGMDRLSHYFTPFQTFVMSRAEEERSRFDQKTALLRWNGRPNIWPERRPPRDCSSISSSASPATGSATTVG